MMKMVVNMQSVFVDTNILVYFTDGSSHFHSSSYNAITSLLSQKTDLLVSSQIVREYYAVASRSSQGYIALSRQDIMSNIKYFQLICRVVSDETQNILMKTLELTENIAIGGRQIHDANIVATMLVSGVHNLLTNNIAHFQRFSSLINLVSLTEYEV